MDSFKEKHNEDLTSTCGLLGVSRQVYYRSIKSAVRRRDLAEQVVELVKQVRLELPRIGTRKLYHILKQELTELSVGRDRLFAILKANHMLIRPKRSYHITTDSHHRFRKHKNVVPSLKIERPEQLWVSDITYVGNRSNPMYLALVTDAYSKKIVGYDVSNSLNVKGSCRALKMANKARVHKGKLVHHSDRGLQYCSDEYQKLLDSNGIRCSMTEAYDPYENAVAERINGILKQEFLFETKTIGLRPMNELVQNSVKLYNTKRPHYSSYYLTPEQMHNQDKIKMRTYKSKKPNNDIIVGL